MGKTVKIWGPPGTGKTTWIENRVTEFLERGMQPRDICCCSFTRSAANVLKERLRLRVGVDPAELRSVGTIHSIVFDLQHRRSEDKIGAQELGPMFQSLDVSYKPPRRKVSFDLYEDTDQSEEDDAEDEGRWFLRFWDWFRSVEGTKDNETVALAVGEYPGGYLRENARDSRNVALRCWKPYEDTLRESGRWDFQHILEVARDKQQGPNCRVVIVDECQDLSPLLWSVARQWLAKATVGFVAGDPNQAIYTFAGASPDLFHGFDVPLVSLVQNWRFGHDRIAFCRAILDLGANSPPFAWEGTDSPPSAGDDSEAFLSRTRGRLATEAEILMEHGIPFRNWRGIDPLNPRGKARGVYAALALREYGAITMVDLERLVNCIPGTSAWLKRGAKKLVGDGVSRWGSQAEVRLDDLEQFKVTPKLIEAIRQGQPWPAFTGLKAQLRDYYHRLAARLGPEALIEVPKRTLATMHAAKGHEWDHVTGAADWATLPYRALVRGHRDRAAEFRVSYVMASRARRSLQLDYTIGRNFFPFPGRAV